MQGPIWLNIVFFALCGLSAAVWIGLGVRRLANRDGLEYEPRFRVPWGLGLGFIAVTLVVLNLVAAFSSGPVADGPGAAPLTDGEFVQLAVVNSLMFLGLVAVAGAWLVSGLGATRRDLGLPASTGQLFADVRLGLLVALAALAPVYAIRATLVWLLDWQDFHPTLTQIAASHDWRVAAAAFLLAAVAAPISEEFLFRLLLQGSLERLEDERLGWQFTRRPPPSDAATPANAEEVDAETDTVAGAAENPYASPIAVPPPQAFAAEAPPAVDDEARRRQASLTGLPHGWAPILASSLLFGLAHLGQGPAPIPLFLFAIMLGYAYQRTHRILPCVVAHMAFNSLSLALTWLGTP